MKTALYLVVGFALAMPALAHADTSVTDQDNAERAADEGRAQFTGGVMAGATNARLEDAFAFEGTYRLGVETPLYLRARVATGETGLDGPGSGGSMLQAIGGVEARGCTGGRWLCLVGGVDAGYQRDGAGGGMSTHVSALAGGHTGVDFGGDHLRARVVVDVFENRDGERWYGSGDLSIGLGYRF